MSSSFNLDPVTRITAGAVGEPGQRTFFIQVRSDQELVTLQAEKQQVQVLSTTLGQLLEAIAEAGAEAGEEPPDEAPPPAEADLELEEPLVPEWRIGPLAIEVDEDRMMIVLIAQESLPDESEDEPATARFVATPAQMRVLSEQAERVCSAGRPRCQFCGFPLEPEGHVCPAQNGHRRIES
ncbi:MAG: DUF3090 family protein [Actinomycetota bacterium]